MKKQFRSILNEKGRKELPNILLAAAECAPLSKTGGLADVVGTLPKALKKLGFDARVITPYHRCIKDKYASQVEHMFDFYVNLGWRTQYCGIERLELDGVCIYLVDSEFYFGDKIYRGGQAEGEQYAFFTRAVLDAIPNLGFRPDIVHCNDGTRQCCHARKDSVRRRDAVVSALAFDDTQHCVSRKIRL